MADFLAQSSLKIIPKKGIVGRAYVFLRPNQPLQMGHTGWGFRIGSNLYAYGATESTGEGHWFNVSPAFIVAGNDIDWWGQIGTFKEMKTTMKGMDYPLYASKGTSTYDRRGAMRAALETQKAGYGLISNNCLDHTYSVVSAYGFGNDLPWKQTHPSPRLWFYSLKWSDWGQIEFMNSKK